MNNAISAVSTTGIYCRAGCVARPHVRNVTKYASSVSAEAAGYRACLRCRPDREPEWVPPESMPVPLRRAVGLISDGVLDTATEDELAAMVGFSPRHLRRLFLEHVGATPSFVARSRRAHFARSLIDDTSLSITEIAFASGFSSVRQMNRVVKEVFHFTPTDLRRRTKSRVSNAADGGLQLDLRLPPLTYANEIVDFLEPRCTPGVENVESGVYRRTLELCGHAGAIEIAPVAADLLRLTVHLPTYSGLVDVLARVRRLFGADMDHDTAMSALRAEPLIGSSVEAAPGTRITGSWDGFESAVRIVVGQQITVVGASTLTGRIAAACGRHVGGIGHLQLDRLFPRPEEIVAGDLGNLGLTERRIDTLKRLADAVLVGDIDLAADAHIVRASLVAIPGIGPWTAELVAMRVCRDRDAFPASDLGIRKGASALVGGDLMSAKDVEALAERWQPHRALAAAHLWRAA
jgi:AraC family transcriptional regulator of adaptative response / DNA-3-methyladenine glycosylase II